MVIKPRFGENPASRITAMTTNTKMQITRENKAVEKKLIYLIKKLLYEGPKTHVDLVGRLVLEDGYHSWTGTPREYNYLILKLTNKLYGKDQISMKWTGQDFRYGIVPMNRPYKQARK